MRSYKTKGIVIHKRSLGEKDYSVTLFTPCHGKIQVIAKGARNIKSKFTGHVDLLNICEVQIYNGPKNSILSDCDLNLNYSHFREDLNKFYICEEIAKMIRNFTNEDENSEDIYELLMETFAALNIYNKETLIFEAFKVKLFSLLGNMPDVYSLADTEFSHFDIRQKKLLKFLLSQPYSEIIRVYLDKKDAHLLQKMTNDLLAYAT